MPANTETDLIIDVTGDTFDEVVRGSDIPVLVVFRATWCPPCRQLAPVVAEIAAEQIGALRVVRVNADTEPGLARDSGVMATPTMHVYTGGALAKTMVGAAPKAAILRELTPYLPTP